MGFWERFEDGVDRLSAVMNAIATAWIGVIMFVAVADVFVREISTRVAAVFDVDVSGFQIHGTHEIVRWSIVAIVFLQLPHCLRMGKHVRSDFFLNLLPKRGVAFFGAIAYAFGMISFGLICYGSFPNLIISWQMLEFEGEGAIRFPVYPMRTILTFGSFVLVFAFFFGMLKDLRTLFGGGSEDPAPVKSEAS